MAAEPPQQQQRCRIEDDADAGGAYRLQKFRLYETRSNFYMIGRDKNRTFWRVLKIDRSEPSELNILEDPTTYTEHDCYDLLNRIHEGNVASGGLKFVTACYGIIGFIKFLGPFYMLIITKRRKIGDICGHAIYSISKSNMIPIPNSQVQTNMAFSKSENRYKKLLCVVDLTKDFFFSYSYDVMRSLQKNLCDQESGQSLYDTMFVWNEYLTRGIRNNLKNTLWTVALVHGFFHQEKLSFLGKQFWFTLIARRSRHYAGTRYLKRGVNEKGRVANDVETEQIVIEDVPEGCPVQISSIVQNRGSIPLFWSQETSRLNLKPDITLLNRDPNYEATKLHFENLVKRYGNPIIILNLIKTYEKKPRERILRAEFANAIRCINKTLPAENRLRFLHWDLHKHFRSISANVLELLTKVAVYTVDLTGIFYCQVSSISRIEGSMISSYFGNSDSSDCSSLNFSNNGDDADSLETEISSSSSCSKLKLPLFQKGVLRTNCIDCLDRTNVAQYAYGLVALGRQLHSMGYMESENIELHDPLADDLMRIYETMGDTLALQYGGSAAHNKIFSERRGQWKAATQSQEFLRTLQRYYSNAYIDAEKQDAINVFLGYFQPQQGKPALWELDSDHHHSVGRHSAKNTEETPRSFMRRSLSDGNILLETNTPIATKSLVQNQPLSEIAEGTRKGLSESTFKISTCETDLSDERCTTSVEPTQLFKDVKEDDCPENDYICLDKHGDECNCSNFLDVDWLSSSGNSFDEDLYERSSISGLLQDNDNGQNSASTLSGSKSSFGRKPDETSINLIPGAVFAEGGRYYTSLNLVRIGIDIRDWDGEKKHARNHTDRGKAPVEYSDDFIRWVNDGEMLSL